MKTLCRRLRLLLAAIAVLYSSVAVGFAGTQTGPGFVVNTLADTNDGACDVLGQGTGNQDCTLREAINSAIINGSNSTITFEPTVFNTKKTITLGNGELVLANNGALSISGPPAGVVISGNNASRIFTVQSGADVTLSGLTVSSGKAGNGIGGAIVNSGTLSITGCTISGNHATGASLNTGGAIYNDAGATLNVTNSTLSSNYIYFPGLSQGGNYGGAIYNGTGATATITNSTLSGNVLSGNGPAFGGGIYNHTGGTLTITSSTVSGNSAATNYSTGGGGIYNHNGTLTMGNSIVAGNTAGVGNNRYNSDVNGPLTSQGYNLIGNSSGATIGGDTTGNILNTDPKLGPLADNGGPTATMMPSVASPAVNAGSTTLTTDQRGVSRPQGTQDDIGAVERDAIRSGPGYVVTTTDGTNNGNYAANDISLREAVEFANSDGINSTITFDPTVFATKQTITTGELGLANDGTLTITGPTAGVVISGNNVSRVFNVAGGSNATLNGLTISSGKVNGAGPGAGIFNEGTLTITGSTISNNSSGEGGGIYNRGTLSITGSTLSGNSAGDRGGGIYNLNGFTATITNSTLSGNSSGNGGGIFNGGTVTLQSSTFSGNSAGNGGGIYLLFSRPASIGNSIIAGNTAGSGPDVYGPVTSQGYNLIGNTSDSSISGDPTGNILNTDARLDSLGHYGGATQTHRLQENSPAIDAGNSNLTTDQRGVARPQRGAPDIGAFEASLVVTTAVDENNNTIDPASGTGTSLREALIYAQSLGGAQTITFAPSLAGQTLTLSNGWNDENDETALRVNAGNITISGPAGGATLAIANGTTRRHFYIAGPATLSLSNLTLSGGSVGSLGIGAAGGAAQNYGTLNVTGCTFSNNFGGEGGAILSIGPLTITDSTFSNNSSAFNGGALRLFDTTTINNSTFDGNSVVNEGGALISFGDLTITNSTFAGNGKNAVLLWDGTADLRHVTVAYNQDGGLVSVNAATTLRNSIVGGNAGFDQSGALTGASSNNLLNQSASALMLATLANNGGPTQTIALQPGSLAIDSGVAIAGLTTDQRGVSRPNGAAVDVGAFELVQTAAAIPIVSPLGGTYESSVQVTINSTSPATTVRYTLDGTTPSANNGQIYTAPFILGQSATVKAIAYGGGWIDSPIASVAYTVLPSLPYWRSVHALAADGSEDLATPASDGIANLLKYAFNMAPNAGDLSKPNITVLPENGTAGLPYISIDEQGRLVIEFLRRKASTNPGITYNVETGDELNSLTPLSLSGATVVEINATWERVTVIDPVVTANRFGRVRVTAH